MLKRIVIVLMTLGIMLVISVSLAFAADVVPNEILQPGTQPNEVGNLESPDRCDNCHGGYNTAVEPAFNWRGSMMANAGRDPIFWATLAVAEQDFDGSGDLCIRCHSTGGWYGGHSTPTNGSGLMAGDADGVDCDTCHTMTNPAGTELTGVMNEPFIANDGSGGGYFGSGMLSLSGGSAKLGPYSDAHAKHQFMQSQFHRDISFCGSCHDVSNPAVGDLAHNNGAQGMADDPVVASGELGSSLDTKTAFNNFPFQYGIVERTFSEYYSGALSQTLVSNYGTLPVDLQAGAIKAAYDSAGGNYADGTPRYFSCQTCHMRATTGVGANKAGTPTRTDLPLHDLTGGNYWMPDVILYENSAGTLRLGGGLTTTQIDAITAGKDRAEQQLDLAASLEVTDNTLKVVNLTGHKLISGYPEGRRMWLNIKWYNSDGLLLREDGQYGDRTVTLNGQSMTIRTILNPETTKVYEAHYGMTQEWANQLIDLGYSPSLPLNYDPDTGAVVSTLGDLASQNAGTSHETFHFVLNNTVVSDNRIPPYGMSYDEARNRNTLPVPYDQYGDPGTTGGDYNYWDEISLQPDGAAYAEISLMYQPTSWEYIQFLYLSNNGQDAFLSAEGADLLDAWLNTGMAEPYVMATATWGNQPTPPGPVCESPGIPQSVTTTAGKKSVTLKWTEGSPVPDGGYNVYYNQSGKLQFIASVPAGTLTYKDTGLTSRMTYAYVVTAWNDCDGNGAFTVADDFESLPSDVVEGTAR